MKKVYLLPFGDQGHIQELLSQLAELVVEGKEEGFALVLPTSHLLHQYRQRLVPKASRRLNLVTFDELVASAIAAVQGISEISGSLATEIIRDILGENAGNLPTLGSMDTREMAAELTYALGQLRREKLVPQDLENDKGSQVVLDLAVVWREYLAFLRSHRLADIEEQYTIAAKSLAKLPWLAKVRQLHICWFFDFEPLQLEILQAVCAVVPEVSIWLPYEHTAHEGYMEETLDSLRDIGFHIQCQEGENSPLTASLFHRPPKPAKDPPVHGLGAPRLRQELELVAKEIKVLAAAGAKARDICLVVPDRNKYLPLMGSMYKECGIDISSPLSTDLLRVPWVRETLNVWQGAARGWDRESLLSVVGNAYITNHLPEDYDSDAIEWTLYNLKGNLRGRQWLDKLDQEEQRLSQQWEKEDRWLHRDAERSLVRYKKARRGLEAWVQLGGVLAQSCGPVNHCQALRHLLQENQDRLIPQGDSLPGARDRAAWTNLSACVSDYLSCCQLLERDRTMTSAEFLEDILPWLRQNLALEGSSPNAIQVLSPSQVRGLQFPWVFILGLNQGVFPLQVQEHWLLARVHEMQTRGGARTLAQQKIFFHSAVAAAAEGLYISRQLPGIDEGAEISGFWRQIEAATEAMSCQCLDSSNLLPPAGEATSRNKLVQSLAFDLARGQQLPAPAVNWLRGSKGYRHLLTASQAIQNRESQLPADSYDGALVASSSPLEKRFGAGIYSISRLELYSRCPFAFFARHCLRLNPAPRDQEEYSPLDKGTLLHWLLEAFYQGGYIDSADLQLPSTIREPLEVLVRQWLEQAGHDPEDPIWRLRLRDAVDMVGALVETDLVWLQRTGLKPVLLEASFGLPGSATGIVSPGENIFFHGKIDRIDVLEHNGETWAIVYDYKTSSEVTKGKILAGRSLQIPVYLTAATPLLEKLGYKNVKVMGGGYYVIKKAKLAGGIWNKEFTGLVKSGLGSLEKEEFAQLENTLAQVSKGMHQGILAGKFVPNPDGNACKYCDFSRCCRYDKYRFKLKGGEGREA